MSELLAIEIEALYDAIDDEYKSWATYDQVITDFGEVRPFINIRDAEARHVKALQRLFVNYNLAIPENPWIGKVAQFPSIKDACKAGVSDELANAELYERLFKSTERTDILLVFHNLHEASQERHLPAFERCAQGRGGCGKGEQRGRRNRV